MSDMIDLAALQQSLQDFAEARDWNQYHNPKNLAMALTAEAGELLELFQWVSEADLLKVCQDPAFKEKTAHELADIMLYLARLAGQMRINLSEALQDKMRLNNQKYPVDQVKGSAKKYDEYQP